MEPRTRRLGWAWWALAFLLLGAGVCITYLKIQASRQAKAAFLAQCQQVRQGATEQEVEAVFGRPGEEWGPAEGNFSGAVGKTWRYDKSQVIILFMGRDGATRVIFLPEEGLAVIGTPPIRIPEDGP